VFLATISQRATSRFTATAAPLSAASLGLWNRDVNDPGAEPGTRLRAEGGVVHVSVPFRDALEPLIQGGTQRRPSHRAARGVTPGAF